MTKNLLDREAELAVLGRKIGSSYAGDQLRRQRLPNDKAMRCAIFTITRISQSDKGGFHDRGGIGQSAHVEDQRECAGFCPYGQDQSYTCLTL